MTTDGLDRPAVLVDAGDPSGQARVVGIGAHGEFFHEPDDGCARLPLQAGEVPCFCGMVAVKGSRHGRTKTLYDEDFVAWSKQQAEALRAAARGGSNQQLDWENLAEEIEDLGKSLRSATAAAKSVRIIQHLVKLDAFAGE